LYPIRYIRPHIALTCPLSGTGRRKRRINNAGFYFLIYNLNKAQLHPVTAERLRRPAPLDVEATHSACIFLLVRRSPDLMQWPLPHHVVGSVEVADDVDVVVQLVDVTLPCAVVAFNHRHDPLVLDDTLGHYASSS